MAARSAGKPDKNKIPAVQGKSLEKTSFWNPAVEQNASLGNITL